MHSLVLALNKLLCQTDAQKETLSAFRTVNQSKFVFGSWQKTKLVTEREIKKERMKASRERRAKKQAK